VQALSKDEIARLRTEARQLNERLIPWGYAIAAYQHENMTKRMDALLKQPEADAEQEESADAPSPEVSSQQEPPAKASLTAIPAEKEAEEETAEKPAFESPQSEKAPEQQ
jgi:hypothetical protein